MAQYCFDFVKAASTISFRLKLSSDLSTPLSRHSYNQEGYTIHWPHAETHPHRIHEKAKDAFSALQTSYRALPAPLLPQTDQVMLFPVIQAGQFGIREEESVVGSLFNVLSCISSNTEAEDDRENLLRERPLVDLTSGYFGLYQPYQDVVLDCPDVDVRIVAASPKVTFLLKLPFVYWADGSLGKWLLWI